MMSVQASCQLTMNSTSGGIWLKEPAVYLSLRVEKTEIRVTGFDWDAASGVLPDTAILDLLATGRIAASAPLHPAQVQPASLDLTLGEEAYRMRSSFLPLPGGSVREDMRDLTMHRIDLSSGGVLEPGAVYLIPLRESLALPQGVKGRANPKSSTGRLDVFARVIVDGAAAFDDVPMGYVGPLWLEVAPCTFPVLVRPGSRLSQLRLSVGDTRLDAAAHEALLASPEMHGAGGTLVDGGVGLSVDLAWSDEVAGWRALRHAGVVDMDRVGYLDAHDFWEPVRRRRDGIVLDPGEFYILASAERVRVPLGHAAEMCPFDAAVGEFRAHYAGFFDPGFGVGNASRAVLEVRPRDVPFLLRQGQPVCRLGYEAMAARPASAYGTSGNNYDGQGLRLSKSFRPMGG